MLTEITANVCLSVLPCLCGSSSSNISGSGGDDDDGDGRGGINWKQQMPPYEYVRSVSFRFIFF